MYQNYSDKNQDSHSDWTPLLFFFGIFALIGWGFGRKGIRTALNAILYFVLAIFFYYAWGIWAELGFVAFLFMIPILKIMLQTREVGVKQDLQNKGIILQENTYTQTAGALPYVQDQQVGTNAADKQFSRDWCDGILKRYGNSILEDPKDDWSTEKVLNHYLLRIFSQGLTDEGQSFTNIDRERRRLLKKYGSKILYEPDASWTQTEIAMHNLYRTLSNILREAIPKLVKLDKEYEAELKKVNKRSFIAELKKRDKQDAAKNVANR